MQLKTSFISQDALYCITLVLDLTECVHKMFAWGRRVLTWWGKAYFLSKYLRRGCVGVRLILIRSDDNPHAILRSGGCLLRRTLIAE